MIVEHTQTPLYFLLQMYRASGVYVYGNNNNNSVLLPKEDDIINLHAHNYDS